MRGRAQNLDAERQWHFVYVVDIDQRPHEPAPVPLEGHDRHRHQDRLDQRQNDPPVDAYVSQAINLGGIVKIGWNAGDELPNQKDIERTAEEVRNDQRQIGVEPAQFSKDTSSTRQ